MYKDWATRLIVTIRHLVVFDGDIRLGHAVPSLQGTYCQWMAGDAAGSLVRPSHHLLYVFSVASVRRVL